MPIQGLHPLMFLLQAISYMVALQNMAMNDSIKHILYDLLLVIDGTSYLLQFTQQVTAHSPHNLFNAVPNFVKNTLLLGF